MLRTGIEPVTDGVSNHYSTSELPQRYIKCVKSFIISTSFLLLLIATPQSRTELLGDMNPNLIPDQPPAINMSPNHPSAIIICCSYRRYRPIIMPLLVSGEVPYPLAC